MGDLCYSGKFMSSKSPDLNATKIPYVERAYVFSDQVTVDQLQSSHAHIPEPAEKSLKAHGVLEEYVKGKRLYYALFHTREHNAHNEDGPKKDAYVFAVGVSPYGNLVGVLSMQLATHLTGTRPDIFGDDVVDGHDEDEEEGESEGDGDDEPDPGAIYLNKRPDPLPDGSPQHIFYHKENESALPYQQATRANWTSYFFARYLVDR